MTQFDINDCVLLLGELTIGNRLDMQAAGKGDVRALAAER